MYRCGKCGLLSKEGEKRVTVVIQTRDHIFPFRRDVNVFRRNGSWVTRDDYGGVGKQIVREIGVHPSCALTMEHGEGWE